MDESPAVIRVFLVDDHEVVRTSLAQLIDSQDDMAVVGESGSAAGTAAQVLRVAPRVALLDISLGDGSGLDVCRAITTENDAIACLMLTSVVDDRALVEAEGAGAAGFRVKSVKSAELLDAIRSVAAGKRLIDPAEIRMAQRRLQAEADGAVDSLTSQERVIFDLIGKGLSNRQIGDEMFLAEKTVKNYVSNVLAKLGATRRTEVAAMAARLAEREAQWRT